MFFFERIIDERSCKNGKVLRTLHPAPSNGDISDSSSITAKLETLVLPSTELQTFILFSPFKKGRKKPYIILCLCIVQFYAMYRSM